MKPVWSEGDGLPKVLFDLKSMLGNGLTFKDNVNAAVITFDAQHGVETRVTNPLKCTPIAFYPHGAVSLTAIGGVSNNVARKIESLPVLNLARTDGFLGITVNYDLAHTTPYLSLTKSGAQAIPSGGASPYTSITWAGSETTVSTSVTWSSSATTRVTVSEAGRYLFNATIAYASAAGGARQAWFTKNGSTTAYYGRQVLIGGTDAYLQINAAISMTAADYVEVIAYQDSGGAVNVQGTALDTRMQVSRIASAETPCGRVTGLLVGG